MEGITTKSTKVAVAADVEVDATVDVVSAMNAMDAEAGAIMDMADMTAEISCNSHRHHQSRPQQPHGQAPCLPQHTTIKVEASPLGVRQIPTRGTIPG